MEDLTKLALTFGASGILVEEAYTDATFPAFADKSHDQPAVVVSAPGSSGAGAPHVDVALTAQPHDEDEVAEEDPPAPGLSGRGRGL